ncbi:MAG: bifunctional phosphoglucose/phosphomannose isomerase [Candidatus Moranbacteria bacterium]|nr:bifunctional phosphoglucose/phosphomannose isomerase [Candidatus Moranbacteria bacterium]
MENKNLDKQNLRQVILDFPKQFKIGLELAKDMKIAGDFRSVVVSGMGGSAWPVDILKDYLKNSGVEELEIIQNRNYSLPKKAYTNSINFFSSYSGDTEEPVASLEEAIKNNLPLIVFTYGGKHLELAKKNNLPCIIIPQCVQPRYATGYFFGAMLQVLINLGLTKDASSDILEYSNKLAENTINLEKKGQELAKKLVGQTPIIYASDRYGAVGMVIKIKINEDAKTPAFWNVYPELNHNEMVGFTLPQGKFHVLTFMDKDDNPRIIKRMQLTAELYKTKGIETDIIEMEGDSLFTKIFSSLILGDWIAYYLALEYGQDPVLVEMVEDFKKLL